MVAAVEVIVPVRSVLALFALGEVAAVNGGRACAAADAVVEHFGSVEKIVVFGDGAAVGVGAVAALAEGVVFEGRGLAGGPGNFGEPGEHVPLVAADAVGGEVAVIVVSEVEGLDVGGGEIYLKLMVVYILIGIMIGNRGRRGCGGEIGVVELAQGAGEVGT